MGSRKGFLGDSVVPFAVMIALTRRLRPALFVHECTRTFAWNLFEQLFVGYSVHHQITQPSDFGFPVKRSSLQCRASQHAFLDDEH